MGVRDATRTVYTAIHSYAQTCFPAYNQGTMAKAIIVEDPDSQQTRERLETLAWLLDSSIPIPGLKITIGVDGLLSLLPVVGDSVSALISSYIVAEAARLGVPKSVLWRMSLNVLIDAVIGMIPFAGDLFDFAWKANQKNVQLLANYMDNPRTVGRTSWVMVVAMFVGLAGAVIGLVLLFAWSIKWLFS